MLSPKAVQLILKHFDSIDSALSRRLLRKRPWHEPALTSLLCDLLDEDVQAEENVEYGIAALNADLQKANEPIEIDLKIETHEYDWRYERYVSQADIGMVFEHRNQLSSDDSWIRGWLLQAKRLIPDDHSRVIAPDHDLPPYSPRSRFGSVDKNQHARIEELVSRFSDDFFRYLLYTPRPSELDPSDRSVLNYRRTESIGTDIFDYTLGLQLREDMLSDAPTIEAGIFTSSVSGLPKSLEEVHRKIFHETLPFSWFILHHFFRKFRHWNLGAGRRRREVDEDSQTDERLVQIVRGDADALSNLGFKGEFRMLPAHTLTVSTTCGLDTPRRNQDR